MNILITSGSTVDFIDHVHYVSNISDGSLAANIGEELSKQQEINQIFYICGKKTKYPWQHSSSNDQKFFLDEWLDKIAIYPVDDVNELQQVVTDIFSKFNVDAVVHLMNIVNYGNSHVHLLDNKKDAANFIEHVAKEFDLSIEIKEDVSGISESERSKNRILSGFNRLFIEQTPTKKILKLFREFKEDVKVVSCKTEVALSNEELLNLAKKSLQKNHSDLVFAMDLEECKKHSEHIVYLVDKEKDVTKLKSIDAISDYLFDFFKK